MATRVARGASYTGHRGLSRYHQMEYHDVTVSDAAIQTGDIHVSTFDPTLIDGHVSNS